MTRVGKLKFPSASGDGFFIFQSSLCPTKHGNCEKFFFAKLPGIGDTCIGKIACEPPELYVFLISSIFFFIFTFSALRNRARQFFKLEKAIEHDETL